MTTTSALRYHTLDQAAPSVGDRVQVVAYGYGASLNHCGRTGIITKLLRARVVITFDANRLDGESTATVNPIVLRRLA